MSVDDSSHSIPTSDLPLIRASELAQYSFCQRAWWLGLVKGLPSDNQAALTRGEKIHRQSGLQVEAALSWGRLAWFLLGSGGLFLLLAFIFLCFGSLRWL